MKPEKVEHSENCDDPDCLECCTHEELDHGVCMDCGEDQSEWISVRDYDAYKHSRE